MRYYYSYGSNMDIGQMKKRCPNANFQGKFILEKYKFIINCRGVATIIPDETCNLEGILWTISSDDENNLDKYEGVPILYKKNIISVSNTSKEEFISALIYIATNTSIGLARPKYIELILKAAKLHKFSEKYIEEIKKWT